jgi:sigma-E factor negative regulatory protein RseC
MSSNFGGQMASDDELLEEIGRIVAYDTSGWVRVSVTLKSACNHCSNSDNCGTSAVAKAFSIKTQEFSLPTNKRYPVGDLVKLGLPGSVILKAAALVYMLPLLGLFLGAVIGQMLTDFVFIQTLASDSDYLAILFGLVGAGLSWRIGKHFALKLESRAQPIIIAHLGREIGTALS